jgi:hypothetical protein
MNQNFPNWDDADSALIAIVENCFQFHVCFNPEKLGQMQIGFFQYGELKGKIPEDYEETFEILYSNFVKMIMDEIGFMSELQSFLYLPMTEETFERLEHTVKGMLQAYEMKSTRSLKQIFLTDYLGVQRVCAISFDVKLTEKGD